MINFLKFLPLLTLIIVQNSNAFIKLPTLIPVQPRVIYGIDDRFDIFESSDNLMKELSHSVAAQILDSSFDSVENGLYALNGRTLADEGMCKAEHFSNQPTAGHCSGFLIGPDTLVTAGHCVLSTKDCQNHYWVFDYANYENVQPKFTFSSNQVVRCSKLLHREKDEATGVDYSVLKLERKITNRKYLTIRKTGKMSDDSVLTVIGFPSGLPAKITTGAIVRDNSKDAFFVVNSDTYGGNSGSAVVDTKSGIVEGILVRGDTDYAKSPIEDCYTSIIRDQDGGRGEDVTRITNLKFK
jgi:V8-like Glu-specific endopeptidase